MAHGSEIVRCAGAKRISLAQRPDFMPSSQLVLVIRRSRSSLFRAATNQSSSSFSPVSSSAPARPPMSARRSACVAGSWESRFSMAWRSKCKRPSSNGSSISTSGSRSTVSPMWSAAPARPGAWQSIIRFARSAQKPGFLALPPARPSPVRSRMVWRSRETPSTTLASRCARRFSAAFSSIGLAVFSCATVWDFSARAARLSSHSVAHGGLVPADGGAETARNIRPRACLHGNFRLGQEHLLARSGKETSVW